MKYSVRKAILICFCLFISRGVLSASGISLSIVNDNEIEIKDKTQTKNYKFPVVINGYNVNCHGTRMVVWGFPVKFIDDSPASNRYVLFDMGKRKIIKEELLAHGIFDAIFFRDNQRAYIASYWGYVIKINGGSIERIAEDELDNIDSLAEDCIKPADWSYNRFPQ